MAVFTFEQALRARDIVRLWERNLEPEGVTLMQASTLQSLEGGRMPVGKLARLSNVTSPVMVMTLKIMEKRGWVERRKTRVDARLSYACITKDGLDLLDRLYDTTVRG